MDILDQPEEQAQGSRTINQVLEDGYTFDFSESFNRVFYYFRETWALCLGHVAITGAIYYFGFAILFFAIMAGGVFSSLESLGDEPDPRVIIESMLWLYPAFFGFFLLVVWPIRAGHFIYFNNRFVNKTGGFGDFFGVFSKKYLKVVAVAFIVFLLMSVWVLVPAFFFMSDFMDSFITSIEMRSGQPPLPDFSWLPWMLLGYIPYVFFLVACSLATPLILFQTDDVLVAVKASIQIIMKKWFLFFGFFLVLFLLAMCGMIACFIGFLVTNYFLPWGTFAIYEDIFVRQNRNAASPNL